MNVSQAESLTLSCCLNLFPNPQWHGEALNPTDSYGCILLQNFEQALSVSQWSWADCVNVRHLVGSPPEQRNESWQFPSTSLGKELSAQWDSCSSCPLFKRVVKNRKNLLIDWNPKQRELHRPKERRIAHPEGRVIIFRKDNQLLCVSHHQPRGEQFLQSTSTSARGLRVWF